MSAPTQVELSVLQQISAELREADVCDIPADTLRWAINRYRTLLLKRAGADARERDLAEARRRTAEHVFAHGCGGLS